MLKFIKITKLGGFFFLFLTGFHIYAESFLSIHGYPQNRSEIEDYQIQVQTRAILQPFVKDILYPVIGFPAMITENDKYFSFILRSDSKPKIEAVKIVRFFDGGLKKAFAELQPYSIEKSGNNLYRVKCKVPVILPSARYDLVVFIEDNPFPMVSWNSVFFPVVNEKTRFYVWADPQIQDLQSKISNLNFNSGNYPFKSDSLLDFSRQKGIIKATVSQMNAGNFHFVTALGDLVFGINYQREYEDIISLVSNLELPFFPVPGNHDGYAKFTDQNNLSTPLEWDGLEYWTSFFGPLYYAFTFNDHTFLMLNTYDGTPQRRASGKPVGIGDNAAPPVSNWGGFQTKDSLDWIEKMIDQYDVFGLFAHMMPLGQAATGKYHPMKKFPKDSIIGVLDSQEWNIETSAWDSDPTDLIFNETQKSNTGLTLASYMTKQIPAPYYFSGHTHRDRIFSYEPGEELVEESGVFATDYMEFISTTTASSSGETYWGFREVSIKPDREVNYNYICERGEMCFPLDAENPGFQSVPAGNMWVNYKWVSIIGDQESIFIGGDGNTTNVEAEIINYLPTKEPVTLRFIMPAKEKGFVVDNDSFKFSQVGVSKDLSIMIVVVNGKIDAGSESSEFEHRVFKRNELSVSIEPDETEAPVPEIEYTSHIMSNENIVAEIKNSDKYLSLVWRRDNIDIFQGEYLNIFFEDYKPVEKITLTYIAPNGAFGRKTINVYVEPYIEEPDEETVEEPDKTEEEPDEKEITEEPDETDDALNDEDEALRKKKGCSVILLI